MFTSVRRMELSIPALTIGLNDITAMLNRFVYVYLDSILIFFSFVISTIFGEGWEVSPILCSAFGICSISWWGADGPQGYYVYYVRMSRGVWVLLISTERKFIRNFSLMAVPLHAVTSVCLLVFSWRASILYTKATHHLTCSGSPRSSQTVHCQGGSNQIKSIKSDKD